MAWVLIYQLRGKNLVVRKIGYPDACFGRYSQMSGLFCPASASRNYPGVRRKSSCAKKKVSVSIVTYYYSRACKFPYIMGYTV